MEKNNIYYVEKNIVEDATPPQILNIVKLSGENNTSTANSYIVNPVVGEDNTFYSIYAKDGFCYILGAFLRRTPWLYPQELEDV